MACNHWMCPMVGGEVFVDQHLDTTGNMTTLADDTFSFHKLQIDDGSHSNPGEIYFDNQHLIINYDR